MSLNPLDSRRKAEDEEDEDMPDADSTGDASKRTKADSSAQTNGAALQTDTSNIALRNATAAAAYIPFLTPEDLLPPKIPTKEEIEGNLLALRKRALVEEYFGQ